MGFTTKDLQLLCNKTENTPLWGSPKDDLLFNEKDDKGIKNRRF